MHTLLAIFLAAAIGPLAEQNMQDYLNETREMARQGRHQEALERHIWFHDNALKHDPSMSGVRVSFALLDWERLGEVYPPARTAMEDMRDRKTGSIKGKTGNVQLFRDVVALNRHLQTPDRTVELFEWLDREMPRQAASYWSAAQEAVVAEQQFDLAAKYMGDPVDAFQDALADHSSYTKLHSKSGSIGPHMRKTYQRLFVKNVLQIIQVAQALENEKAVTEIRTQALDLIDDPELRRQLKGEPEPKATPAKQLQSANGKRMWAKSILGEPGPELVVEKWLGEVPDTEGKFVLIDFWATWCGPCVKAIPDLNEFHATYGDQLVVIGISDESEAAVKKMKSPTIEYFSAIDSQARMKKELEVTGIPHVILMDPKGIVRWEGFPRLSGYELTDAAVREILETDREEQAVTTE